MVDKFSTFAKSPQGPYDRAKVLTPALGEFETTTAIHVNATGQLTCLFGDDTAPVTITFDKPGLYPYRIKQVNSFTLGGTNNQFSAPIPALVGLY